MVMLKDNHIWSHGSITNAVQEARKVAGFSVKIEVECQSFEEATEAIQAGADVGARHAQRVRDFLGVQRLAVKKQQRVNLRHGAVDAPGGAHFAPVEYEAAGDVGKFHAAKYRIFEISVKREIDGRKKPAAGAGKDVG